MSRCLGASHSPTWLGPCEESQSSLREESHRFIPPFLALFWPCPFSPCLLSLTPCLLPLTPCLLSLTPCLLPLTPCFLSLLPQVHGVADVSTSVPGALG